MFVAIIVTCLIGAHLYGRLRKKDIPGPDGLPILGSFLSINGPNRINTLEKWSYIYGPLYKVNMLHKTIYVCSDFDGIKSILNNRPKTYHRGPLLVSIFQDLGIYGLFSDNGEDWKQSRQLVAPAFSSARILSMRPCIVKHVVELRKSLLKVASEQNHQKFSHLNPTEDKILPLLQRTTMSIVLDIAFLWGNDNLVSDDLRSRVGTMFKVLAQRHLSPLPFWKIFPSRDDRIAVSAIQELNQVIGKIIETIETDGKALVNDGEGKTLLHAMARAKESESMPEYRLRGNIIQVMLAGYETTASSLMWVLFMLSRHQEVQFRVQTEVDSVFQKIGFKSWNEQPEEVQASLLESLTTADFPYTMAVIYETIRLRPVAPFLGVASGDEQVTLCGHVLPKRALIFMLFRKAALSACPSLDPYSFNPNRWIKQDDMDQETFDSYHKVLMNQLLGFGGGPRVCPGRHLALLEMTVILTIAIASTFTVGTFPVPPGPDLVTEHARFTMIPDHFYPRLYLRPKP